MRWLKVGGVVFGAMAITALGIDATDTLSGSQSTLMAQLIGGSNTTCPDGMVEIAAATSFSCADQFEASPEDSCPVSSPNNQLESDRNLADQNCGAASAPEETPWRFIDRESAQLACVRAGKRLPTNEEWQLFAAGTPDQATVCNIDGSGVQQTNSNDDCVSASGVFDAVGNVWEWTHEDVFDGNFNGRPLPETGYVAQVDRAGVATVSTSTTSSLFGEDYFWSEPDGVYAIMRGGFYASRSDAGVYAVHAATVPTMQGAAIGFRCVL